MSEPVRTLPNSIITAKCMDCEEEFTGPLAIRFIQTEEGPGLEINVVSEPRHELHAIGRIERDLIPVAKGVVSPLPHVGEA